MQKKNYKIISINQKYMLAACVRTSDYILTMGILTGQLCLLIAFTNTYSKNDGQKQN
jgi:hypothetical protein